MLLVTLFLSLQAPVTDAAGTDPPPPALLEVAPPAPEVAPPAPEVAPPPPEVAPPAAEAAPPPPPTPAPTPKPDAAGKFVPAGMDPIVVGGVQVAAGTGACCVGCCVSAPFNLLLGFIPIVGSLAAGILTSVIAGVLIGGTETFVGDFLGKQRAPMLWPVVAAGGSLLVGAIAQAVVLIAVTPATQQVARSNDPDALRAAVGSNSAIFLGVLAASVAAAVVAPAAVYGLTAIDKKPGDTGQGFPGILVPANPAPAPPKSAALPVAVAMRY